MDRKLMGSRWTLLLLLLPLCAPGCAVGHYYGSFSGRVLDSETAAPLEGAVVVALYKTGLASLGGKVSMYADSQETRTDRQGEFTMPGKFVFRPRVGLGTFDSEPRIYVAKPGYAEFGRSPTHPRAIVERNDGRYLFRLPRLKTMKERLEWHGWDPTEREAREKLRYFVELENEDSVELGLPPLRKVQETNK